MNKRSRNIFITGATGFLASHLLRLLLTGGGSRAYLLIRAKNNASPEKRKNDLIDRLFPKAMRRKAASRIHILEGDVSKHDLGLGKKNLDALRNIHEVYHCAAICKFNYPLKTISEVNVNGTESLLKLALDWRRRGQLEKINHVSTVYIAGDKKGIFCEKDVDVSQGFNNSYEQTKFEAELTVNEYRKRSLHIDVYRPSIITDTMPPSTDVLPGFLWLLGVFMLGIFKKIPVDADTKLNMIPVDAAAKAIYLISTAKKRPFNQNYHIVSPEPLRLGDLLDSAGDFFGIKKPECVSAITLNDSRFSPSQQKIIAPFIPYLNQDLSFDAKNTTTVLKKCGFKIQPISKDDVHKSLEYYKNIGFIRPIKYK